MLSFIQGSEGAGMPDREPNLSELAAFVKRERKRLGLRVRDLAGRGGPSAGWVSQLETGKMIDQPKPASLDALAVSLGLDFHHLMRLAGYAGRSDPGRDDPSGARRHLVPLYGPVAAGEPLMWTPEDAMRMVEAEPGDDAAFVIRGNSVSDYGVWDGDIVYGRKMGSAPPVNGDMVVVEAEGSFCCKIYRETKVGRYLESHEKDKQPEPFLLNGDVRLVAVVTRLSMKFRRRG